MLKLTQFAGIASLIGNNFSGPCSFNLIGFICLRICMWLKWDIFVLNKSYLLTELEMNYCQNTEYNS